MKYLLWLVLFGLFCVAVNMAGNGNERWSIDKLESTNWTTWKFQVKHMLLAKDLWKYVTEDVAAGANAAAKADWKAKAQKSLAMIVMSVSTNQLYLITSCEDAKSAWKALSDHFECSTLGNKLILKKQYFRMEMAEQTSVEQHLKQMKELTERLAAINSPVIEEDQVVTLLGSLPSSYQNMVTSLETRGDDLKLGYVQQALLYEEKKRPGTSNGQGDSALAVRRNEKRNPRKFKCYGCGDTGHFRNECPKKASMDKGKDKVKSRYHRAKAAEAIETESEGDDLFKATIGNETSNNWLIDSGASCHMTNQRDGYTDFKEFEKPQKVSLGDGHKLDALGRGTVVVNMMIDNNKSTRAELTNALYVPDLRCNLFSVRSATENGKVIHFAKEHCFIHDENGNVKGKGVLVGKLYQLSVEPSSDCEYASLTSIDLWHNRLGHMSERRIRDMVKKEMVTGVGFKMSDEMSFCEGCVEGKMTRKRFKALGEIRAQRKLERVHSDVCGPMQTESPSGKKYFITFTDDFSRCSAVYFLNKKSEALEKFKEFEKAVTNETGLQIGALRTDNGGEYLSKEFQKYLVDKGIKQELTVPHTPEQNGVAERLNRTLVESGRAMMAHAGLPMSFWAEAVATAVYLKNRICTSLLKETTPYETWYGRKPDLKHLKVFGCSAYALIPEQRKLEKRAKKMCFVGYDRTSKGYRLYDAEARKVLVRRDVAFNEEEFGRDQGNRRSKEEKIHIDDLPDVNDPADDQQDDLPDVIDEDNDPADDQQERTGRAQRRKQAPTRFGYEEFADVVHYALNVTSLQEALESEDASRWKEAADSEFKSLEDNETWELVTAPVDNKIIGCKWVFKEKTNSDGSSRFKARLVAKGYAQIHGVDYQETFSPVVRFTAIRVLLAIGIQQKKFIHQMDVITAFLHGDLEEDVYMRQPEGYEVIGRETEVCKLKKSIYGLKQSPRCWNAKLHTSLIQIGFNSSDADPCVYICGGKIIAVYVDDLILLTDTKDEMESLKNRLSEEFNMKDLGEVSQFLGVSINRSENNITLHQRSYIEEIVQRFNMSEAKTVTTPSDVNVLLVKEDGSSLVDKTLYQSIAGALLYVSMATRPDIAHAVGVVCRYNAVPTKTHMSALKRIICYLKGTSELALTYNSEEVSPMYGYSDADWAGDRDTRLSTSGYVFMIGGGAVSWSSKKQKTTALSTAEAEYIALSEACKEVMWLRKLLGDLTGVSDKLEMTTIMEDNQAATAMVKNPVFHARSKHIDIRYHYIRELHQHGKVTLMYCPTESMTADVMTKSIPRDKFELLREMMGVH